MRHVIKSLEPLREARLLDDIVKYGNGDIEIREDENDHSPIVYSKNAGRGIHLENLTHVWPIDTIAENIVDAFETAVKTEDYLSNLGLALDNIKGI